MLRGRGGGGSKTPFKNTLDPQACGAPPRTPRLPGPETAVFGC
jgi:hypothetical protein